MVDFYFGVIVLIGKDAAHLILPVVGPWCRKLCQLGPGLDRVAATPKAVVADRGLGVAASFSSRELEGVSKVSGIPWAARWFRGQVGGEMGCFGPVF